MVPTRQPKHKHSATFGSGPAPVGNNQKPLVAERSDQGAKTPSYRR